MGRRSGWTIDTLRKHVLTLLRQKDLRDEQRFQAQNQAINAALLAAKEAAARAETANDRRFDSVNEFRAALDDKTRSQVSSDRFESVVDAFNARLRELAARVDKTEGKSTGLNAGWSILVAAVLLAIAVISFVSK